MELKDFFLEKLEQESEASRKVLERVPEGRNDWKPHDKSMALGQLAALVATMPGLGNVDGRAGRVEYGRSGEREVQDEAAGGSG